MWLPCCLKAGTNLTSHTQLKKRSTDTACWYDLACCYNTSLLGSYWLLFFKDPIVDPAVSLFISMSTCSLLHCWKRYIFLLEVKYLPAVLRWAKAILPESTTQYFHIQEESKTHKSDRKFHEFLVAVFPINFPDRDVLKTPVEQTSQNASGYYGHVQQPFPQSGSLQLCWTRTPIIPSQNGGGEGCPLAG